MNEAETTEDVVKEIMQRKLPTLVGANDLYKAFLGETNIERVKEETYVMKELLKGTTKNKIIETLKAKYPDYSFNYDDMERFIARNDEIVAAMGQEATLLARRHLEAKTQCHEHLAAVALFTEKLIEKYDREDDRTNTVAAIRVLNQTLENVMKLQGHLQPDQQTNVINLVNAASSNKGKLKDRLRHRADFINEINIEATEVKDEDGKVQ